MATLLFKTRMVARLFALLHQELTQFSEVCRHVMR